MTLTEFLLARYDEDASDARQRIQSGEGKGTPATKPSPARVLTECEAKRRIVENWRLYSEAQFPDYEGGYSSAMDDVLKLLALPYADHEDFRAEWAL